MRRAMKMYMETLELDPSNGFATLGLANIMAEHGKIQDAVKIYSVLKDNMPGCSHSYINLAIMHIAMRNFDQATNLFEKVLEKFENSADEKLKINLYMAKIHFMREEFDKAREIVNSQLKLTPEDLTLKFDLAVILLESST